MPVVLVIIIVAAWAVILGPSLLKRRANSGGVQSITHFHHQLRVLEQRAPEPIVAPAYRLRSVDGTGSPTGIHYPDDGRPPVLTVVGAKELPVRRWPSWGSPRWEPVAPDGPPTPSPAAPSPADSYGDRDGRTTPAGPVPIPTAYDHRRPAAYAPPVDPAPAPRAMRVRHPGPGPPPAPGHPGRPLRSLLRHAPRRSDDRAPPGPGRWPASTVWPWPPTSCVLVHLRRMAQERELKLRYLDPGAARPVRPCPARRATSAAATPTRRASRPSPADRAIPVTRAHRRTRR